MNDRSHYLDIIDYEIIELLGKTDFAEVYKVKHKLTKKIFASKIIQKRIKLNEISISDDLLNFSREVNIMSKLNHPSIIKLIGLSPIDFNGKEFPVLILEYAENKTLAEILELERKSLAKDKWDYTKKLTCIYSIASAMKYLHQNNVLHRDLKSSNILMDSELNPKIADFGLSKMNHTNQSSMTVQSVGLTKGTPTYMAPEVLKNSKYSKEGDVYAFAFIVFEIMTGKVPYENINLFQLIIKLNEGYRPAISVDVPDSYRELIERCWSQEPNDRPSFDEIEEELRTNPEFLNDAIDKNEFESFIDFINESKPTFEPDNKAITIDLRIHKPEKPTIKPKNLPFSPYVTFACFEFFSIFYIIFNGSYKNQNEKDNSKKK